MYGTQPTTYSESTGDLSWQPHIQKVLGIFPGNHIFRKYWGCFLWVKQMQHYLNTINATMAKKEWN
jgi:hypothetical protein